MSQRVEITINIENAAFEENGSSEVARILRKLADDYENDGFYIYEYLHDINGNVVGKTALED